MSMFERPSEDSQLFSAPEPPKRSWRSWPRIISAFAAGVACTFLIVTFSRESAPPLEQLAKSAKVIQGAEPPKVGEPKASPAPPAPEAARAQSGTPAPMQPAQSPVPSEDPQRSTTAASSASPPETGDDAAAREASSERRAAPEDRARGRDSAKAPKQTPDARTATRSEPAASREHARPSSSADSAENSQATTTESQSIGNAQRAREAREARRAEQAAKARERQARRNAERSEKRRTVRTEEAEDGESRDDSRWVRDDTRGPFRDIDEVRRPTREAPARGTRKRADPADQEDGEVVVRSQRSRDGRERAVYEEPRRERQLETRTLIREEAPRPRVPFIFDLFGGGNSDD